MLNVKACKYAHQKLRFLSSYLLNKLGQRITKFFWCRLTVDRLPFNLKTNKSLHFFFLLQLLELVLFSSLDWILFGRPKKRKRFSIICWDKSHKITAYKLKSKKIYTKTSKHKTTKNKKYPSSRDNWNKVSRNMHRKNTKVQRLTQFTFNLIILRCLNYWRAVVII